MKTSRTASLIFVFIIAASPAFAQEPAAPSNIGRMGVELASLAVLVLIVESALTTIFQWRLYRMLFNNRAMKTVVMAAVGLLIVLGFHYDIFARSIALLNPGTPPEMWSGGISAGLSALIIAGGSAGVNTMLQGLGIRNPVQSAPERPALADDQAWFSIRVKRASTVGPVQISVREMPEEPSTVGLAGTVAERSFLETVRQAFVADAMRFPSYGGRTVKAGKCYEIAVIGLRQVGNEAFSQSVYKGSFAPRAIVDFTVTF